MTHHKIHSSQKMARQKCQDPHRPGNRRTLGIPKVPVLVRIILLLDRYLYLLLTHHSTVSGLQSSRGTTSQSATRKPRQQDKDKFQFVGWNDEAKRTLYRWKRILKKGPSFFLHQFPGETEASVRDAWDKYGEEGKRLYEEWEAAEEE